MSGNGHQAPRGSSRARAGREGVRQAVNGADEAQATPCELPAGFEMREDGLWRTPTNEKDRPFRICGPFEVVAESRPETADEWGLLLRWKDRDGTAHEWIMPRRLLAGEAVAVRERFSACGLDVSASQGARQALLQFLAGVRSPMRVRTVPRVGWFGAPGPSPVFVLPAGTIGAIRKEIVRLDMEPLPTVYAERGTLEGWRREVAARCMGNSRLIFGVACAFAPVLLPLVGEEGGGINLRGESSKGKTTIIDLAANVWGPPSKTGPDAFVRAWRATSNALEQVATTHNHALLPMDEMGQSDPKELGETLYMLANGTGKERAKATGGNRRNSTWTTLVLSSSEESAASIAAQAGRRIKAGQEVRLLDVPAVVPGGHGCFETLHGAADGAAFSRDMRQAVLAQHGTPIRAFLDYLCRRLAREADFIRDEIETPVRAWIEANVPKGAEGQVQRAARRLALVAVAGELATVAGVTKWPAGAAGDAAGVIFRAWLTERGGTGSREDHHLFGALRHFITAHGAARFEVVREKTPEEDAAQVEPELPDGTRVIHRAGWRWQEAAENGERRWIYGMSPEVFAKEVAGPLGLEEREACARLARAHLIRTSQEGGQTRFKWKARSIPGAGRPRLIVVDPRLLEDDEPR